MFAEGLPVHFVPATLKHIVPFVGVAGVVEDELGGVAFAFEFEARDRVETFFPIAGAPGLDYAFAGHQFNVTRCDLAAEKRYRAACL